MLSQQGHPPTPFLGSPKLPKEEKKLMHLRVNAMPFSS